MNETEKKTQHAVKNLSGFSLFSFQKFRHFTSIKMTPNIIKKCNYKHSVFPKEDFERMFHGIN